MDYFLKKENDLRFREAWKFDIRWGMKPQAMSRSPYSGLADLVGFGFLARGLTPGRGNFKTPFAHHAGRQWECGRPDAEWHNLLLFQRQQGIHLGCGGASVK